MRETGRGPDRNRRFPTHEGVAGRRRSGDQPSASDMLGLNGDGAYHKHVRRELEGKEQPLGEEFVEEAFADAPEEEVAEDPDPRAQRRQASPPGDEWIEITGKYVLYTDGGMVVQANSLRGLCFRAIRKKLGSLIAGD